MSDIDQQPASGPTPQVPTQQAFVQHFAEAASSVLSRSPVPRFKPSPPP